MSELISGKEAKLAWATNKDVEYMPLNEWYLLGGSTPLSIFDRDDVQFRLKPRTITLNGIEVPAPFEPKEGEYYWSIGRGEYGYYRSSFCDDAEDEYRRYVGAWRTEAEIKQVVAALRSVFKGGV